MKSSLLLLSVLFLLPLLARADSDDTGKTIYIQWSVWEKHKRADWSGRAEAAGAKIVRVEKDSGPSDTVHEDSSWEIIYGRGLDGTSNELRGNPRKGILLTIQAADLRQRAALVVTAQCANAVDLIGHDKAKHGQHDHEDNVPVDEHQRDAP